MRLGLNMNKKQIIDYVLEKGREIGYLDAIKELYKDGFTIEEIQFIKANDLIMSRLEKECRRKNLLKNKDRKKLNY